VFSSGVCLAANLQFIASIPNGDLLELDRNPNPLRDELINESLSPDAMGVVTLPDRPGLGIDLNPEIIKKYRCD
jgi:L-alanine-DL-glutamate epimerase-like enolase superfamily enzyme